LKSSTIWAPGNADLSASTNEAFVDSSGRSPASLKPLPVRKIENGAYAEAGGFVVVVVVVVVADVLDGAASFAGPL
jgi:hypothetical protein